MGSQTHRQIDWLLLGSWLLALVFCVASLVMVARLIEWAAT